MRINNIRRSRFKNTKQHVKKNDMIKTKKKKHEIIPEIIRYLKMQVKINKRDGAKKEYR